MKMGIHYGFYIYEDNSEEKRKKKYESLSEKGREYYHKYPPMLLVAVDIGEVTEHTIPAIAERIWRQELITVPPCTTRDEWIENYKKFLKKFIGFQTNVSTISSAEEWAKKRLTLFKSEMKLYEIPKIECPESHQLQWIEDIYDDGRCKDCHFTPTVVDDYEFDCGNQLVILYDENGNVVDEVDLNCLIEDWLEDSPYKYGME